MMVEEFSLVGFNDRMNKKVERIKQLKNTATENAEILGALTNSAQKKHEELTRLHENANTLYRNMSRQSREWNESRQAVLLKACGVVAIIVLAFTSMCGNAVPAAGTAPVRAVHITELRAAVVALE